MPKICSNCGTSNRESAVLCKKCGTMLNVINTDIPVNNAGINNDKNSFTTPYPRYVFAGIAVLLCGVLVWFFVFRNQWESESDLDNTNTDYENDFLLLPSKESSNSESNFFSNENKKSFGSDLSRKENKVYDFSTIAKTAKTDAGMEFVSNIINVYFKNNASNSDKEDVLSKLNGEVVGKLDILGQYQIKVKTGSYDDLHNLCNSVKSMNNVLNCTIDYVQMSSDHYYPKEGYSDKWDQEKPAGDNYAQEIVRAPEAWTLREAAEPVKVAVIDSGFDVSHPDLSRITINSSGNDPKRFPDHGTAVAGFIGADFDNSYGIAGIAPNAVIEGYSIGSDRTTNSQIYNYVIEAVNNGNKIINISWGSSGGLGDYSKTYDYYNDGWSASLLISNLLDEGYDFIIVQSAGNGAGDGIGVDAVYNGMFCSITRENCYTEKHSYEEIIDHIIIVAATETNAGKTTLTKFSNGGKNVTLCAPGANVYGLYPGNRFKYWYGTSFSAPLTAGAVAYLWGLNTYLSAADIKYLLTMSSTVQIPSNTSSPSVNRTYPFLNVGNATIMMPPPPEDWPLDETKLAFYDFMKEKYNNADEYVDGMPLFYIEGGDGIKKPDSGSVWYQYSIADFDGDGENELLINVKMFMGRYGIGAPDNYNYEMKYLYEWNGTDVEMYNYCTFDGDLNDDDDIEFYNNGVICVKNAKSLYLFIFNKSILDRLGMHDGEYIIYSETEGNDDSYIRTIGYKFGGLSDTISKFDCRKEIESILTGKAVNFESFWFTEENIGS